MIGKRYTRPLIVVMFAALFAAVICNTILNRAVAGTQTPGHELTPGVIGLLLSGVGCLMIAFGILLWLGTYHFLMKKRRVLSASAILLGLLLSVGSGSFLLLERWTNELMLAESSPPKLAELQQIIHDDNMPLPMRSAISRLKAGTIYVMSGKIVQIIDPDGKIHAYIPSPEDISQRNQAVQSPLATPAFQATLLLIGLGFFFVALLSSSAGLFCARHDTHAMGSRTTE